MNLQNNLFTEDVEYDVTLFTRDKRRKRVLVFPPVNSYHRFLIHQCVQEQFADLLHTFSIGQGDARRTVVCYKADLIRDPKLDAVEDSQDVPTKPKETMGVERSPSASPERVRVQRQVKSLPKMEIYRPPAARRAQVSQQNNSEQIHLQPAVESPSTRKGSRQRRPDRAVYVPRHRRSLETEGSPQPVDSSRGTRIPRDNSSSSAFHGSTKTNAVSSVKSTNHSIVQENIRYSSSESRERDEKKDNVVCKNKSIPVDVYKGRVPSLSCEARVKESTSSDPIITSSAATFSKYNTEGLSDEEKDANAVETVPKQSDDTMIYDTYHEPESKMPEKEKSTHEYSDNEVSVESLDEDVHNEMSIVRKQADSSNEQISPSTADQTVEVRSDKTLSNKDEITNHKNTQMSQNNRVPAVLIISDAASETPKVIKDVPASATPPEKKVKKIERPKSKPAPPPVPSVKINRDECDWDSLFDDNGDCLDPTLIEELTSAVGDVAIEQPKNDYKSYAKHVEVSSDEFGHVVEIYNFPSEFKTSDLAAVFSPFKNGGFELKWVDDTHCLGVFSSPLIAAEVLASDHPFVKTRPLSEATALSKTKAKRSAEFLQPYRSRPETCAALARRLVTGALGVKLATARQEREHEKNVLREAKEKRRLANKQREDAWEGIIPEK